MFRSRRQAFAVTYTFFVVIGFVALWRNSDCLDRLERWLWEQRERQQFIEQFTGGAKALAEGRFKIGDSVEDLLAAYPTPYVLRSGVFTTVRYPKKPDQSIGIYDYVHSRVAVAKNGRLIYVEVYNLNSGVNSSVFNKMTPADHAQYNIEYEMTITNCQCAIAGAAALAPVSEIPTSRGE